MCKNNPETPKVKNQVQKMLQKNKSSKLRITENCKSAKRNISENNQRYTKPRHKDTTTPKRHKITVNRDSTLCLSNKPATQKDRNQIQKRNNHEDTKLHTHAGTKRHKITKETKNMLAQVREKVQINHKKKI